MNSFRYFGVLLNKNAQLTNHTTYHISKEASKLLMTYIGCKTNLRILDIKGIPQCPHEFHKIVNSSLTNHFNLNLRSHNSMISVFNQLKSDCFNTDISDWTVEYHKYSVKDLYYIYHNINESKEYVNINPIFEKIEYMNTNPVFEKIEYMNTNPVFDNPESIQELYYP
jgi:hypothetical protein